LKVAGSEDFPSAYGLFTSQLSTEQPGSPSMICGVVTGGTWTGLNGGGVLGGTGGLQKTAAPAWPSANARKKPC
jgi:hypothetical protein